MNDLRFAFRQLRNAPVFTITAQSRVLQASLRHDWEFATDSDTTEDFHSLHVLKTST